MKNLKNKVLNIHINETCNYKCKFCFSEFQSNKILPLSVWENYIDNILQDKTVTRINIAGGEPFLYPELQGLINYIYKKGVEVSIITNGSFLTEYFIENNKNKLAMIGLSLDSFNEDTLLRIGRHQNGTVLSNEEVIEIIKCIKKNNIKLKINSTVNVYNKNENLKEYLLAHNIVPDRWKILNLKPFSSVNNKNNHHLIVPSNDFLAFYKRNFIDGITVAEFEMKNSYILIDNTGNLLETNDDEYKIVGNLMAEPFSTLLEKINFNQELYKKRYEK